MKSKRKAIKDLTQSKIVKISDYRSLQQGKEVRSLALIGDRADFFESLKKEFPKTFQFEHFDSRFSFEQSLKSKDWAGVLIDERSLKDDALQLCEKLKRQNKMEELTVFILSDSAEKEIVRRAYEKGCDEWVTKLDDLPGLVRLLGHHIDL